MDGTKRTKGPESPADLQWSQGAKNPRNENQRVGTLFSDTTRKNTDDFVSAYAATTEPTKVDISSRRAEQQNVYGGSSEFYIRSDYKPSPFNRPLSRDTVKAPDPYLTRLRKIEHLCNEARKRPFTAFFVMEGTQSFAPYMDCILYKIHVSVVHLADQNNSEFVPKITRTRMDSHILVINCATEETLNWLKTLNLNSALPSRNFKILTLFDIADPVVASVFIPGRPLSNEDYFRLFAKQNEAIKTDHWAVVDRMVQNEPLVGVTLRLEIDPISWEQIVTREMKLCCGLPRVTFVAR